jgi:membrane associated rhomboid family serine protease
MKKYLPETAWILNIIGLVMLYTYDTWGANFVWYRFMGCMSILIGSAINTYIDFPQPFRAAKRSKKIGAIFSICFIATFAILLVYSLYMKLMGQSLEI